MKILQISERDGFGGAHIAARRLHLQLIASGLDSTILVQRAQFADSITIDKRWRAELRARVDAIPARFARAADRPNFSVNWLGDKLLDVLGHIKPDLVHLHWINDGFIRLENLPRIPVPVVWTLHDCWPFTGGCHIPYSCDHYTNNCGECPRLRRPQPFDLSYKVWQRKFTAWRDWRPTIVTPSQWMADKAQASSLMRSLDIRVIRNGIQTASFQRKHPRQERTRKKILVGAVDFADPNKGQDLLRDFLGALDDIYEGDFELNLFGTNSSNLGLHHPNVKALGYIDRQEIMAELYADSDVYLSLSRSENLPTSAIEALASGTPCVAFDVGGTREVISHRINGYLAEDGDVEALAQGVANILRTPPESHDCSHAVQQEFDIQYTAAQHRSLYEEVLGG